MCRHLAYLGPPVTLASLMLDPPFSLLRQSFEPRDMRRSSLLNADGFGAGWYRSDVDSPVRYRRAVPLWTDNNFRVVADEVRSGAMLCAIRAATTGMPIIDTACAPFAREQWLFSHNGKITDWP